MYENESIEFTVLEFIIRGKLHVRRFDKYWTPRGVVRKAREFAAEEMGR
jgi:hypothetical protein